MKFRMNVVQTVEVDLDESKFTEGFMEAFSSVMFQADELVEYAEYIARHKALFDGYACEFISEDMYKAEVVDEYVEED